MTLLFDLLIADTKKITYWFKTQTISKVIVLIAFLGLGLLVSYVIFVFSRVFFANLSTYQRYGEFTSHYIIHAAVIIVLWLACGSTIATYLSFFRRFDKDREYMSMMPISPITFVLWSFVKTAMLHVILVAFLLAPMLIGYVDVYVRSSVWIHVLSILVGIFIFVSWVSSIGAVVGSIGAKFLQKKGKIFASIAIVLFLGIGMWLLQTIFPRALTRLYLAEPNEFFAIYNTLPLSNTYLPTYWLTKVLTGTTISILLGVVSVTIAGLWLSILLQKRLFFSTFQHYQEKGFNQVFRDHYDRILHTRFPLFYKDILSIIRSSSETTYGFFLIILTVFFFAFFNQAVARRFSLAIEIPTIIFLFAWIHFFVTAYVLRLSFPLMAREGNARWFLLTNPVSLKSIFLAKTGVAMVITTPFFIIATLIWLFVPLHSGEVTVVMLHSLYTAVLITLIGNALGTYFPNFSSWSNPEKISTSFMGLTTLIGIIGVVGFSGAVLYFYLYQAIGSVELMVINVLLGGLALLFYLLSLRRSTAVYAS